MQAKHRYLGSIGQWPTYLTIKVENYRMTAIAAVSAPWGVLMAADGRMTLDDAPGPVDEQTQKLFPIIDSSRTMVYGLAGSIARSEDNFDMRVEFRRQSQLLAMQDSKNPLEYLNALCLPVAVAATNAQHFPTSNGKSNNRWKVAEVIVGGCFGTLVFLAIAEFSHLDGTTEVHVTTYREGNGTRFLYGSEEVAKRMYDYGFNPIPNSPLSQHIVSLSGSPLVSEAKRFAVGYIEACCSLAGRQLDPKGCKSIGGHIHAATVKPRSGFQWVVPPLNHPR